MTAKNQPFIDALMGERIGGRYVVERVLGMGGMGVVAAGRYPELGQEVAIKFLRPELAASSVLSARFLREARLAGRVKSAHFVRVFDLGKLESGIPYLVMELLSGRDLGSELDARGALPIEEAVDYVLQALIGIAEIHALGIIHRDLKPSNLFVSEAAGSRTIKVLDFGISKESGPESSALTATDNLIGTPQYMSPEQVKESRTVDETSDVWSLGVILYELLTRQLPFVAEGGAVGELFGLILFTDPIPPTKHRADLPPELAAIILKCLARNRGDRYASVLELAEALRPFAPASASHRIQAVKQALATTDPERLAERAARQRQTDVDADRAQSAGDVVPTVQVVTPEAKRKVEAKEDGTPGSSTLASATPATRTSGPAAASESIATSMTSSQAFLVVPPRPARSRAAIPIAVGGATVLAIAGALLLASSGAKAPPPLPTAGGAALTVPALVDTPPAASTVATTPAASTVATTPAAASIASAATTPTAHPSLRVASTATASAPRTPPRVATASHPSATSAPPPDLLLDRK